MQWWRGARVASVAVLCSRFLGLLREQVFAYYFGARAEYDAFVAAFRLPNLLRDLLAEGALSGAFVTVFVHDKEKHGLPRAFAVANLLLGVLGVVMLGVIGLGIWQAPWLMHALAPGFSGNKLDLAVLLSRLMWPFIGLAVFSAVLMAMLNTLHYFALPQSASSFFNLTSVGVGLCLAFWWSPAYMSGQLATASPAVVWPWACWAMAGMAVGTVAGGMVQCLVQLPLLWRCGFRLRPRWNFRDPSLKRILTLFLPGVVSAAAVQVNVFVNTNFASRLNNHSVSWLSYAFRLVQFPIGLFGVALVSALLPRLVASLTREHHDDFIKQLSTGMLALWMVSLPAAMGLMICAMPIVGFLFQHGKFDGEDTLNTQWALQAYCLGVPGYVWLKLLQPSFVAIGFPRIPMQIALLLIGANYALNTYLLRFGHVGLALCSSLLALCNAGLLTVVLLSKLPQGWQRFWQHQPASKFIRVLLASSGMAAACWLLRQRCLLPLGFAEHGLAAFWQLMVLLPVSVAGYAALLWGLRLRL